jgi:hypothetical protein
MGALILPLIGLIWTSSPQLALIISGSISNIFAALILMGSASRIEQMRNKT